MKIYKIISLSVFGLLFAVSNCSAVWTIDNGINNNSGNGVTASEPTANPVAGTYTSAQSVSLTASGADSIRYTTNGATPSCSSGTVYSSAISVGSSMTIKAISCYLESNGSTSPSNVGTYAYAINIPTGGGGGGGGVSSTPCSSVTYSEWQTGCFNGVQFRSLATQSPSSCVLTSAQQAAQQRACTTQVNTNNENNSNETGSTNNTGSNQTGNTSNSGNNLLDDIRSESQVMSTNDTDTLLSHLGSSADNGREQAGLTKYKTILGLDKKISTDEKMTVNDFIVYGTKSTQRLGAGERAGLVNSYYQAYKKLPNSEAEWSDVIKIANGRWPSERNALAENQAKTEFKKVYVRSAVMTNNVDSNAIMIIAYGLLPLQRNMASENTAIKTFRWVYGHAPINALAWNVVRAIAYSGATR